MLWDMGSVTSDESPSLSQCKRRRMAVQRTKQIYSIRRTRFPLFRVMDLPRLLPRRDNEILHGRIMFILNNV